MSTLYITTQGASVHRNSGQIVVRKNAAILQNIPDEQVKQITLVGNVNLSTPVMAFCLDKQIEVVFLTQGGKFRGRLDSGATRAVDIRKAQYDRAHNKEFCLRTAKAFIYAKIHNQLALARRQNTSPNEMATLAAMLRRSKTARDLEALRGIEGAASAGYFKMFRAWIPSPFVFKNRVAHPPTDEVNALLSLSYTLIHNRITTQLNFIGLDPYMGFFHQARNGHAALASDLVEEFRPVIGDALVLKLVRRKFIKPEDFERVGRAFNLSANGKKVFFREFESKMAATRLVTDQGDRASFSRLIEMQARKLTRVIRGETKDYCPFKNR